MPNSSVRGAVAKCADGTTLEFEWVYPGAEDGTWSWNRAHWPLPLTPMELWFYRNGVAGADLAWEEVAMEPFPPFYRWQFVGPFLYSRDLPFPPDQMKRIGANYRACSEQFGGCLRFWKEHCEPRIRQVCTDLAEASLTVPLLEIAERWDYGLHQTFTSASLLAPPSQQLTALLVTQVGEGAASLLAFEVTQGGQNASQQIDAEVRELARLARESEPVSRILQLREPEEWLSALSADPRAAIFMQAFNKLLEQHGARGQGWEFILPTWRERPESPLALVRSQLAGDAASPEEMAARSATRRHVATEEALSKLPPEQIERFHRLIKALEGYVDIREGRAYWQMTAAGQARGLLLRHGERLVERKQIDRADDVFFLVPEEFEDGGLRDLRRTVAARREEWERWRQVEPPLLIGAGAAASSPPLDEMRGVPGSRGTISGRARILQDVEDEHRLEQGDILVCVMTTPSWTPLFGVAGGIITETGGPFSHPAITAREYGIPCVVALHEATKLIADGQFVTIDGSTGVVTMAG
jgi:rifampicin phosphotransferase